VLGSNDPLQIKPYLIKPPVDYLIKPPIDSAQFTAQMDQQRERTHLMEFLRDETVDGVGHADELKGAVAEASHYRVSLSTGVACSRRI